MTSAIFLVLFFSFFVAVLNFLPEAGTLSTDFGNGLALIISYMKAWNSIFPITELLTLAGIVTGYYLLLFLWKGLQWVTHVVRGSGTQ